MFSGKNKPKTYLKIDDEKAFAGYDRVMKKIITSNRSGSAYEIRVRNHLEKHWSSYFMGWSIVNLENGEVLLTTPSIDQAGLHGVLNKIRDLNLTLLSVRQIEEGQGDQNDDTVT